MLCLGELKKQEGNHGPGVAHLRLLDCDSKIWPSDLVFDPTWPIFILFLEIVKANILSKFNEYLNYKEVSRVYTRFF